MLLLQDKNKIIKKLLTQITISLILNYYNHLVTNSLSMSICISSSIGNVSNAITKFFISPFFILSSGHVNKVVYNFSNANSYYIKKKIFKTNKQTNESVSVSLLSRFSYMIKNINVGHFILLSVYNNIIEM